MYVGFQLPYWHPRFSFGTLMSQRIIVLNIVKIAVKIVSKFEISAQNASARTTVEFTEIFPYFGVFWVLFEHLYTPAVSAEEADGFIFCPLHFMMTNSYAAGSLLYNLCTRL